jgi:hypothetical protein
MKGIVSFHPADPRYFEGVISPLVAGRPVTLDAHLDAVVRIRRNAWQAGRWTRALGAILESARIPELEPILTRPQSARELIRSPQSLLQGIKARFDRFDHRLDAISRLVVAAIDEDLHVFGRPFLVTESSPKAVADAVDRYLDAPGPGAVDNLVLEQLGALDVGLVRVEPDDASPIGPDLEYRSTAFRELQFVSGVARAAREGQTWLAADGARRPAAEVLKADFAWTAVRTHARAIPAWIARDVDGLATMCDRAGVPRPPFLTSSSVLFSGAGEVAALLAPGLHAEIESPRDVGCFVAPDRIADLLEFLSGDGARIIRAAARYGEGPAATRVLRKIRECASYAHKHGSGYLETSGILPPGWPDAGALRA